MLAKVLHIMLEIQLVLPTRNCSLDKRVKGLENSSKTDK